MLENNENFGKINNDHVVSNRYTIQEYKDKIDSTFYNDMATATLVYTIEYLQRRFNEQFSENIMSYVYTINENELLASYYDLSDNKLILEEIQREEEWNILEEKFNKIKQELKQNNLKTM